MKQRPACLLFAAIALGAASPAAIAAEPASGKLDRTTTGSVMRAERPPAGAAMVGRALDALRSGDTASARALRDGMPAGSLERRTLAWAIGMSGARALPSADIAAAAIEAQGWPGADTLRANSEKALAREALAPADIIAAFGGTPPQTFDGALALARALKATGRLDEAGAALAPIWARSKLEADEEKAVIAEFGSAIARSVHRERMERMLYDDRVTSAGRVAALAGASSLHRAWAAVIRKEGNAAALLDAVPAAQRAAGWHFAKTRLLRRAERISAAAETILAMPRDATVFDANEVWNEQQILARDLIDAGKPALAYKVAANHRAQTASRIADAEFHAGWIALRFLNDPATATAHFARLRDATDGPISRSRAHYWLGRAAEAQGRDGRAEFQAAARHATTYYGQLAAARIGVRALDIAYPQPGAAARDRFNGREWVQAARLLVAAGHAGRAAPLIDGLADTLDDPGELALLAVLAERAGLTKLALQVGKGSAQRGLDVGALTHPVGAIPEETRLSDAGRALAYAIARQESEFHTGAVSPAGALGLLQLMPGTARDVATRAGLPYSKARLTSDPGYNATLGARYLSEQIDRFGGSYILTFIAYNAGPRRAEEWVARYGDPEGRSIDEVVDWVELIPFAETRSYVQRVMENYQVYKWRLSGTHDIERDLRFGRD